MAKREKETAKKEKRPENECTRIRWVLVLILSIVVGNLLGVVITAVVSGFVPAMRSEASGAGTLLPFFVCFWVTVFFIKKLAGTSFRSFVQGREHKSDKKQILVIMGLYLLGFVLGALPTAKNIGLTTRPAGEVIANAIIAILFTWFQTTTEELWFRGIFARFAFGNDIKKSFGKAAFWVVVISSLLFMLLHVANPEVKSVSGIEVLFAVLTYFVAGVMLMVIDLHTGSLEAGMGVHWLNNFLSFALVSAEISAGGAGSVFVDHTVGNKGLLGFVSVVVTYAPVLIYILVRSRKNKAAAVEEAV